MTSIHTRRSSRLRQLVMVCAVCAASAIGGLQAQGLVETYRAAARAYREAADKATASRRPCFLEWAKYYDDYAEAVLRGSGEPKQPTSDPGCPAR